METTVETARQTNRAIRHGACCVKHSGIADTLSLIASASPPAGFLSTNSNRAQKEGHAYSRPTAGTGMPWRERFQHAPIRGVL